MEPLGKRIARSLSLIIHKEKCLIAEDRSAECAAKLIFTERRRYAGLCKKVSRIENIVAKEFKKAAVEGVATRFCNDVDYRAGFPPNSAL